MVAESEFNSPNPEICTTCLDFQTNNFQPNASFLLSDTEVEPSNSDDCTTNVTELDRVKQNEVEIHAVSSEIKKFRNVFLIGIGKSKLKMSRKNLLYHLTFQIHKLKLI